MIKCAIFKTEPYNKLRNKKLKIDFKNISLKI